MNELLWFLFWMGWCMYCDVYLRICERLMAAGARAEGVTEWL